MARDELLWLREGKQISTKEQIACILRLSIPAILAQISTVVMEYIDASMVGRLGPEPAASIGLVSSPTWLTAGVVCALGTGYTVQVAHKIGAGEDAKARDVVKHGLLTALMFALMVMALAVVLSNHIPVWLGGSKEIITDAAVYFRIFSFGIPTMVLGYAAGGMLQCSGNMRIPSILNMAMCVLDVVFNSLLIFPSGTIHLGGLSLPGAGLGVMGAALGTALSEAVGAVFMLYFLLVRSEKLHIRSEKGQGQYISELKKALQISIPIAIENMISGGAQVVSTRIVSPLGTIAIAAHSFSITAEGICYMPGYGISSAATALVGQGMGAKRYKETHKLSFLTVGLGMAVMSLTGIGLYVFAPQMLSILTPTKQIQTLGVEVLRIEAFAEPFFAASIVTAGVFRGKGKTLISTILNMSTMWFVRLPLAWFLSKSMGLRGVWIAMCLQLILCGSLFLLALIREKKDL